MTTRPQKNISTFTGCLMSIVAITMVFALLSLWNWWNSPVRMIKESATDVREYYEWGGITGDHSRLIKAHCSEEFFHQLAKRCGMLRLSENQLPNGCPELSFCPEAWWTPPRNYRGAYVEFNSRRYRTILIYSNGVLWYDEDEW